MRKKFTVNHKRPVNLDLGSLKYPPMAIASLLHRLSGLVLFLLFPVMLYLLSLSLQSETSFTAMKDMVASPYYKFLLWVFSAALVYHVIAGIRHILMDMGLGESLAAGRRSAISIIILAIVLTIFLGIWIW